MNAAKGTTVTTRTSRLCRAARSSFILLTPGIFVSGLSSTCAIDLLLAAYLPPLAYLRYRKLRFSNLPDRRFLYNPPLRIWAGCAPRRQRRPKPEESPLDFEHSPRSIELQNRLLEFMDEHIYPNERTYAE